MSVCQVVTFDVIHRAMGSLKPDVAFDWYDEEGDVIDFTGAAFRLRAAKSSGGVHLIEKTTGIVGAATLPNVQVAFAPGDLTALSEVGVPYVFQLRCTSQGDRPFPDFIIVFDASQT